jgi:bifunctional non-homologous end joining protein LigD
MPAKASKGRTARAKAARRATPLPLDILEVELATLTDAPPEGGDWLHEIKLDGYRIVARIENGQTQLYTRRGNDWTARAPNVATSLAKLPLRNGVLDGEIVSLQRNGVSSFQALQNALSEGRSSALVYFAFDLMFLDGEELRQKPLLERKAALAALLARASTSDNVRLSEHVQGEGKRVFQQACKLGLEGTIAKRATAPYRPGRNKDWLKIKCIARQEFVIGGYTPPGGSRQYLGALLIGLREKGALRYAGKVGTGFSAQSLRDLHGRLTPLERSSSPFTPAPKGSEVRGARWVEPRLVAEIAFTEFTHDGRLRHPSFQGLREDKPASAVVRERAKKPAT